MSFLAFSNADIYFDIKSFIWSSHNTAKVLAIVWRIKLINKQAFAKKALDKNTKMFVLYVVALETLKLAMSIYFSQTLLLAALQ